MTEAELKKLSKIKLEEYARTQGIELDRRKTKAGMIAEFFEKQDSTSTSTVEEKPAIVVKSPDEVVEDEKAAEVKAEGDAQLKEFMKFISGVKSADVGNPTMWMLGALGKYITGHKVKCNKDPETGIVTIESEGPSINGKFNLK
tara:strand:- start:28 stop:459 length:432 start_codon:yes stop_codon:yes gene_type:complete